jgi:hypothetical protein
MSWFHNQKSVHFTTLRSIAKVRGKCSPVLKIRIAAAKRIAIEHAIYFGLPLVRTEARNYLRHIFTSPMQSSPPEDAGQLILPSDLNTKKPASLRFRGCIQQDGAFVLEC